MGERTSSRPVLIVARPTGHPVTCACPGCDPTAIRVSTMGASPKTVALAALAGIVQVDPERFPRPTRPSSLPRGPSGGPPAPGGGFYVTQGFGPNRKARRRAAGRRTR